MNQAEEAKLLEQLEQWNKKANWRWTIPTVSSSKANT